MNVFIHLSVPRPHSTENEFILGASITIWQTVRYLGWHQVLRLNIDWSDFGHVALNRITGHFL